MRYPIGVGRPGRQWSGTTFINGKGMGLAWAPPPVVRRDKPNLPSVIPSGAANNPLGAAVIFLAGREAAIHGTREVTLAVMATLFVTAFDRYARLGSQTGHFV